MKIKFKTLLLIQFSWTLALGQDNKPVELKELWGHRYRIFGDFKGNKKKDTLIEHFVDILTGLETNKYFTARDTLLSSDQEIKIDGYVKDLAFRRKINSFLSLKGNKLDTLNINGQFGLIYLKNIGDVNNDGKDEIALVNDYADYSNLNTCLIYKLDESKWTQIYRFPIHEDWIPSYNWNGNLIDKTIVDPIKKIGKGLIEVRICEGGDLKILKVSLLGK